MHRTAPMIRIIKPKKLIVPRLRNVGLDQCVRIIMVVCFPWKYL